MSLIKLNGIEFVPDLIYLHCFQLTWESTSRTILRYTPTTDDDGRYLTCNGENPAIDPLHPMEDSWTIQVHCKSKPFRDS